jgi:hypothetical protein
MASGGKVVFACAYCPGVGEPAQVPGKMRAVRRNQVWMLFGGEIPGDDEAVAVLPGQNQIGARACKVPPEQKLRVGNINSVGM